MAASQKNNELISLVKQLCEVEAPWGEEFEKMISGMTFKTGNVVSMQQYKVAITRNLQAFNNLTIQKDGTLKSLRDARMQLGKGMFGKLGADVNIVNPFFVGWGCNTFIADGVYINRDVSIFDDAPVFIGKNTLIGPGAMICTSTHDIDPAMREKCGGSFAKPIRIGDHCWIGAKAIILPGVTIGNGSTIAAGAVVTKDVEPMCVMAGVPARYLRSLEKQPGADKILPLKVMLFIAVPIFLALVVVRFHDIVRY